VEDAYKRLEAKKGEITPEDANLIMDMLMVPNTSLKVVSKNAVDLFVGAIETVI